jgi:hypothetical protein
MGCRNNGLSEFCVFKIFEMSAILKMAAKTGSGHYSDSPLLRQPIAPTAHFSDNPLFRQKWSKVV